jgi:predicted cupin superfamily sugar epimerase
MARRRVTARADSRIRALGLVPHPEGGFYRETYRSKEFLSAASLPRRYGGRRSLSTAIYFLLRSGEVSRLHRLLSDEVWHFYEGLPLRLHVFMPNGRYRALELGREGRRAGKLQLVVPRGAWFGAEVIGRRSFSLVGCTIAPGFDFADFTLGRRTDLLKRFPSHDLVIERLTK